MSVKRLILIVFLWFTFNLGATEFKGVKQVLVGNELQVKPQFDVQISQKVHDAIESGIVITFVVQAKINQSIDWWFDTNVSSKILTFEVRYFSLSNQYQLHNKILKTKQSFVDLDQLLQHLGHETSFVFPADHAGDYLMTRIFLDKQALPSIMQLPNVFDADWNLNSDWQATDLMAASTAVEVP